MIRVGMKTEKMQIREEFSSRIPPLEEEEFRQLEENILSEGCVINPIVTWNGVIVDGHNRYRIIRQHPEITYTVFEKEFTDDDAAMAWICRNQLGRRNLTPNQRKYLIGKQYSSEKHSLGGARNIKGTGKKDVDGQDISGEQSVHLKSGEKTCERIAKENHVSHMYVQRAEKYADTLDQAEKLVPGIRRKILCGDMKVTAKEIVQAGAEQDPGVRKERMENLIQGKPGKKKEEISRIKAISEQMATGTGSGKGPAGERQAKEQSAAAELTDSWESFRNRWDLCFDMFIDESAGEKLRKKIRSLTAEGIRYLKKKEEEINEIDRTPVPGNYDQQQVSGSAALQLPEGAEPGKGTEDRGGIRRAYRK